MNISRLLNSTLIVIAVAILGYMAYTLWVGFDDTLDAISRLGWSGVWLVLLLSVLNYALRFARWHWYLSVVEHQRLTPLLSLRYYIAGFAFTTTPGKAGEMIRSLFLHQHGIPYPKSISMFFVERLSDLLAMIILSALALLHFREYVELMVIPLVIVISVLVLIQQQSLILRLQAWFKTILSDRINNGLGNLFELVLHARRLLNMKFLYGGLVLSLFAWAAEGVGLYLIVKAIGLDISLPLAISIYAISTIVGALSFLPGGLGSAEASMLILLSALGASSEAALAATLLCRFATLWFAVIIGAAVMMGLKVKDKSKLNDLENQQKPPQVEP